MAKQEYTHSFDPEEAGELLFLYDHTTKLAERFEASGDIQSALDAGKSAVEVLFDLIRIIAPAKGLTATVEAATLLIEGVPADA